MCEVGSVLCTGHDSFPSTYTQPSFLFPPPPSPSSTSLLSHPPLPPSSSPFHTHTHTPLPQIASYEAQLERLLHLQQLQELMDPEDPELQLTFEEAGVNGTSSEALSQAIDSVQTNLEGEQQKLATLLKNLAGEVGEGEEGKGRSSEEGRRGG